MTGSSLWWFCEVMFCFIGKYWCDKNDIFGYVVLEKNCSGKHAWSCPSFSLYCDTLAWALVWISQNNCVNWWFAVVCIFSNRVTRQSNMFDEDKKTGGREQFTLLRTLLDCSAPLGPAAFYPAAVHEMHIYVLSAKTPMYCWQKTKIKSTIKS